MPQRVLIVVPHYVPAYRYGGPLHVARGHAKALVKAGHEVTICTTNLADETHDLELPVDQPVELDGAKVYYSRTRYSRYWGYSPMLRRRVAREMPRADFALIHFYYQYASLAAGRIARKHNKPYVVFAHGSLRTHGMSIKSTRKKRHYLRWCEGPNLDGSLFVAFNAPDEREESLYRDHGRVIPNGIDPDDFAGGPPRGAFRARRPAMQGKLVYLFLGRIDVPKKGLDMLLPAFAALRKSGVEAHLVLAGPDQENGFQRVREIAGRLGIADDITLPGMLTGEDKVSALRDADVYVLPSLSEGLSISLLEGLYSGLPVLITDRVGLHQEVAAAGAGLVVPAEAAAIEHGVRALADSATRESMRGRGTVLVEQAYTWPAIMEGMLAEINAARAARGQ